MKHRYDLNVGGYGSGKSLALFIKMILMCLCFPGNTVLLGRKHLSDIELTILPDLIQLLHPSWFRHRVKDNIIQFFNNSQIVLFGLDALQEGSLADIKKAQQRIKSLNLGSYFIDQLEEVEKDVFFSLNARLRKKDVPLRQGNMTCNPANFWAYELFEKNPEENFWHIHTSMLENRDNLPEDYIQDQLNHDDKYVRRYVFGDWSPDVFTEGVVFPQEYIKKFEIREPKIEEGCKIWFEPIAGIKYQMGIDPSEGSVDPSSISVISEDGVKVAKFKGKVPIHALIEKTKFLYHKYSPLIIPEVNNAGQALLMGIRDLKIYYRKTFDYKAEKESEKVGWKTNYETKQALIAHFQDLLRKNFPKIYDKDTIEEFKTFVWSDEAQQKGAGAQRGFHDDDVISTLLGYWGLDPKKVKKYTPLTPIQEYLLKNQRSVKKVQQFI